MSRPPPPAAHGSKHHRPTVGTNRAAIASLVLGSLGMCFSYLTGIPGVVFGIVAPMSIGVGIPGIGLGIIALIRIGNDDAQMSSWTVAVAGLVLCCTSILWLLLFLLIQL